MKMSIIGAGAVGATSADNIARRDLVQELILLDIKEGVAEGKAQDIMQTKGLLNYDTTVIGVTNDYKATADSEIVVITSGLPRKPGMTREELIGTNAGIVQSVVENVLTHSPNTIIVIVSNPMDTMTYLTLKKSGLPKNKIIGMGGILDSARFKYQISKHLHCAPTDLNAIVVGGHGDTTMIPLIKHATWNSIPVRDLLSEDIQNTIIQDTMVGGATLTKLLGTSAWYGPGASVAHLSEAIINDEKRLVSCCVYLEGEYNQNNICLGVPVVIGKSGWESIQNIKLSPEEQASFEKSAQNVRVMNDVLKIS
ncbi:MAG: malate dehydrogenase [Alphaproteobacteria bacterium]|nr:malate dehydrogenase [Alphaproteobacteria bacterium]